MDREEYTITLRKRVIEQIDDLREKMVTNEACPEGEQDMELLLEINERLDECLSNWYY